MEYNSFHGGVLLYKVGKCLLSDHLKAHDLTQTQLAEMTSITKSQISEYVNDKHIMSLETAKTIAHVLDCDIEELYQWIMVADDSIR
jgi:transcriptional regulator with XRE-family HTH domain